MVPTEQDYRSVIRAVSGDIESLSSGARENIFSLTLSGSLVRGDFRAGSSDIDIHLVLRGTIPDPQASDDFCQVRDVIRRRVEAIEHANGLRTIVDLVCMCLARLPGLGDGTVNPAIKMLSFYRFDLQAHHEVLWGEDFASKLPPGPAPRSMVVDRLASSLRRAEQIVHDSAQRFRAGMLAVEAVKAIQLLFADPPSIHKADVSRVYRDVVPDFPGKADGWRVWNEYLAGKPIPQDLATCARLIEFLRNVLSAAVECDGRPDVLG